MLPKGSYDITSDDILMRTLRRGGTKKSVSTWQEGLANVIAASIPHYSKTALHGLDSPRVAAIRASRRRRDHRDTAFNCDSEEEFAMFLSHWGRLTEELRQQMLTDGAWDPAVIKMEMPYGSTLEIESFDGRCDVCRRPMFFWRRCSECSRSCGLAQRIGADACQELWRSFIWRCFECPWMSHAWIYREHR